MIAWKTFSPLFSFVLRQIFEHLSSSSSSADNIVEHYAYGRNKSMLSNVPEVFSKSSLRIFSLSFTNKVLSLSLLLVFTFWYALKYMTDIREYYKKKRKKKRRKISREINVSRFKFSCFFNQRNLNISI